MYIRRMVSVNSAFLKGKLPYDYELSLFFVSVTVCQVILVQKLVWYSLKKEILVAPYIMYINSR